MNDEFLVTKRNNLELSQQQVADRAEIDRSYYTKIENGLTPSVKVAKSIGEVLEFEWTLFFEPKCVKSAQNKTSA